MAEFVAFEYFPGGNTPNGFHSYYSYVMKPKEAKREIILKGGPGTGKSTLMKKVAARLIQDGHRVEYLHCSSDPDSLDAVVARELGAWMVDGTSPHTQDPIYPGAVEEIVNLGQFWDTAKIAYNRNNIIQTQTEISDYFAQAYRYLSAAQRLAVQIEAEYRPASSLEALEDIIFELQKPISSCKNQGEIRKAFLSAITPKGLTNYIDSFMQNAAQIYLIESENKFLSAKLMNTLAKQAADDGVEAVCFYCAMSPENNIEHIYLPECNVFYTTSNSYHSPSRLFHAQRITLDAMEKTEMLPEGFLTDKQTYSQFIDKAIDAIAQAKQKHDQLETYYSPAMDFSSMDFLVDTIVQKFEA